MMPQFLCSVENQFIVECVLANFKKRHTDWLQVYAPIPINWQKVLQQAMLHEVAGLVYRSLANQTEVVVPSTIMEQLKHHYYRIFLNQARMEKLCHFFDLIRETEIILLKGPAIEMLAYPSFAPREYCDVDIIIHPEDWPRVRTALQQLNYHEIRTNFFALQGQELTKQAYSIHHIGVINHDFIPLSMEIHWRFFDLGILRDRDADIWERTISLPDLAPNVRSLGIEDLIPYLCVHMNRHYYPSLKWFVDILALVEHPNRNIDWSLIVQRYHNTGVGTSVYYGLLYTKRLFRCQIPCWVFSELQPGPLMRSVFELFWNEKRILQPDISEVIPGKLKVPMLILDSLRDKLLYLRVHIWPLDELIKSELPEIGSASKIRRRFTHLYILLHRYLVSKILPRRIVEQIERRLNIAGLQG